MKVVKASRVEINEEDWRMVKVLAMAEGISVQEWVGRAVEEAVKAARAAGKGQEIVELIEGGSKE